MKKISLNHKKQTGFSIVELIVVILVIGILAAITIVSYSSIIQRVAETTIQSDLLKASSQIKKYQSDYGSYPTALDANKCPSAPIADTKYCLASSTSNRYILYAATSTTFTLIATNTNGTKYIITENTSPIAYVPQGLTAFVKALGGTSEDSGVSLVQTTDGGYAVTGVTGSYGVGGDMLIAKYDLSGNLSWFKTWGGTVYDYGTSLIQTTDGGYAVTGATRSYGAGERDMFIAKYDSSGNLSWSKTWGGAAYDEGRLLIQTNDGGYAVTGRTQSFGAGGGDMFIAKYDSSGNLSWSKTWGGIGGDDCGFSLVQTTDGGYAVTGQTNSYGAGGYDMFIAKYDSSGNLSWSKTWGGIGGYDHGYSLVQTTDGGYAVAGGTNSYGAGSGDMFIAKYDSSGNLSWSKTWGGASNEYGISLVKTNDGGYAITGRTTSYGDIMGDVFLAKYDSSGNLSWSKTWGGADDDSGGSLVQTIDDGYAIIGSTKSYGLGNYDILLVKYDSSGSIANCPSPTCQNVAALHGNPTATVTSPSAAVSSPSAAVSSPSISITTPSPTLTVIAPKDLGPGATITFSSQELYIAYPGASQTVCKDWNVPNGKFINGFYVSNATEKGYDFFKVSLNGVEKYKKSGLIDDEYVNVSATPGTILSACMISDAYTQDGYGGEVTGVYYK